MCQMNQRCELWQDTLYAAHVRNSELQVAFHWGVFAFYCTAPKKPIILVVKGFIQKLKLSLGATNCCLVMAVHWLGFKPFKILLEQESCDRFPPLSRKRLSLCLLEIKNISRDALVFNSTVHARCNLQGVGTRELRTAILGEMESRYEKDNDCSHSRVSPGMCMWEMRLLVAFMKFWQQAYEESNLPFQVSVSYFSLLSSHKASFPEVLLSTMMYLLLQEQLPACTKQTRIHDSVAAAQPQDG